MEPLNKEFLLEHVQEIANSDFDGHFTLMKFTTNWKACFGTPEERHLIDQMATGKTMEEALLEALRTRIHPGVMKSAQMLYDPPY